MGRESGRSLIKARRDFTNFPSSQLPNQQFTFSPTPQIMALQETHCYFTLWDCLWLGQMSGAVPVWIWTMGLQSLANGAGNLAATPPCTRFLTHSQLHRPDDSSMGHIWLAGHISDTPDIQYKGAKM